MAGASSRLRRRCGLKFERIDDVVAEVESLQKSGYERVGKWSLGQNCNHIAQAIEMSFAGFPITMPFPVSTMMHLLYFRTRWFAPLVGRLRVPTFSSLSQKESIDDSEGIDRLRNAVERLKNSTSPMERNPIAGRLTREEWARFHMNHAQRHLSFLIPHGHETVACHAVPNGANATV